MMKEEISEFGRMIFNLMTTTETECATTHSQQHATDVFVLLFCLRPDFQSAPPGNRSTPPGHSLHLHVIYLSIIFSFGVCLLHGLPNHLCRIKKHASVVYGIIEFHSHAMIIESSSSHFVNLGSLSLGASSVKWLAFPFFKVLPTS